MAIKHGSEALGNIQAITYSGPTYIAIRNAKHSSATACGELHDMKKLLSVPQYADHILWDDGSAKLVRIVTCDGGQDDNPRYQKTIICVNKIWKKTCCLICYCNT